MVRTTVLLTVLLCAQARAEDRVAQAKQQKEADIRALFAAVKVSYPPAEVFLRAFKTEKELELWAGEKGRPLVKIRTYPFCYASGQLGPKRRMGDLQVPEGFYRISHFNPRSNFHLSLGLNYPNASDRVLGERGNLGGDIYIHGSCVSIGCIALEDEPIKELYVVASAAGNRGAIPVHVFPRRMDDTGVVALEKLAADDPALGRFWKSLVPGYALFEQSRRPPRVEVDAKGAYRLIP